jgi:predicted nucleic-acid-binding protein
MRALVIDTNALISFVTDRNLDQQKRISTIFNDAAQLKVTILCPQNVLTEFVYVLEKIYKQSQSQIRSMIADFIALPGVQIIHTVDFEALLEFWPDKIADFGDAIIAVVCKAKKGAEVATFDERFIRALQVVGLNSVRL